MPLRKASVWDEALPASVPVILEAMCLACSNFSATLAPDDAEITTPGTPGTVLTDFLRQHVLDFLVNVCFVVRVLQSQSGFLELLLVRQLLRIHQIERLFR